MAVGSENARKTLSGDALKTLCNDTLLFAIYFVLVRYKDWSDRTILKGAHATFIGRIVTKQENPLICTPYATNPL